MTSELDADAGAELFSAPDWTSLGLVLAIVGCFLIANGILFRNPRSLVAERLGRAPRHLRHLREYIFHRVQLALGFSFAVAGFAAQLWGHTHPTSGAHGSPVLWIALVVVIAVVLEIVGWWWSQEQLRRHVRAFLRENPPEFETDPNLARDIGELFGVESRSDETVQGYAARLRSQLRLAPAPRPGARAKPDDARALRGQGMFGEESDPSFDET